MYLASALVCWVLAWQLVVLGMKLGATHTTGQEFTFLPVWPFALVGAFCVMMMGWGFLVQSLNFLVKAIEKNA